MPDTAPPIWTIGHSTRSLEDFLTQLAAWRIDRLADVRRFPGSRRYQQYLSAALAETLPAHGIAYRWFPELGGRRKVQPDSTNTAWRNASFQGYADYMQTPAFQTALAELKHWASDHRCAYMCAEAVWWRCHRSMISDQLKSEGWHVVHIMDPHHATEHPYTSPAHIVDGKLSYAGPQLPLLPGH